MTELLFHGREKDETLMIKQVWTHMGATPYEDNDNGSKPVGSDTVIDKAREIANEIP